MSFQKTYDDRYKRNVLPADQVDLVDLHQANRGRDSRANSVNLANQACQGSRNNQVDQVDLHQANRANLRKVNQGSPLRGSQDNRGSQGSLSKVNLFRVNRHRVQRVFHHISNSALRKKELT